MTILNPLIYRILQLALQNVAYWAAKGRLLPHKRWLLGLQSVCGEGVRTVI